MQSLLELIFMGMQLTGLAALSACSKHKSPLVFVHRDKA